MKTFYNWLYQKIKEDERIECICCSVDQYDMIIHALRDSMLETLFMFTDKPKTRWIEIYPQHKIPNGYILFQYKDPNI